MNKVSKSKQIANDTKYSFDKRIGYGKKRSEIDFINFGLEFTLPDLTAL